MIMWKKEWSHAELTNLFNFSLEDKRIKEENTGETVPCDGHQGVPCVQDGLVAVELWRKGVNGLGNNLQIVLLTLCGTFANLCF